MGGVSTKVRKNGGGVESEVQKWGGVELEGQKWGGG